MYQNRLVRPIIVLFFLTLAAASNLAQSKLLGKYHFEDGGYTFIGIFAHMDDHPLQRKMGEFYTDDIAVLNALKKAWVFRRPQKIYACGYHYYVMLLKNGSPVEEFAINLSCEELVANGRSLVFDLNKLDAFSSRVKPLHRKIDHLPSVAAAREYWTKIHSDPNLVYADEPKWLGFEGEFSFKVPCEAQVTNCLDTFAKIKPKLQAQISDAYPGERFSLRSSGGSTGKISIDIETNKSLEEKFSLFDRSAYSGKWKPYILDLCSYWKR
jgi:hypothetical protein